MATSEHHDALQKMLNELRSRNEEVRIKAAKALRNYVGQQIRDMSGEHLVKFMTELNNNIFELVNSSGVPEKIGGLMAIDELIDVDYDDNGKKVTQLANFLRIGMTTTDQLVMLMASKALGRLARSSGTLTAECVEFEVKRALEGLQERERNESRRQAAVLVLKELAHNSPTLFYVHVSTFVDLIWVALRDPKTSIREAAAEALRACLELIAERESRMRLQWYQKILDETNRGFKSNSPEILHGSLITLGELLRNTGDFMQSNFKDSCDRILKYKDNKDRLVKRTVIVLLPRLALYSPEVFVHNYLNTCMNHLITSLKNQADRGVVFIALGEICMAVGPNAKPYLENIVAQIKAAAPGRGRMFYPETLTCVSMLASAVGQAITPHMNSLLLQMFATGLCNTLIESLRDLMIHLPTLAHQIQQKLLDLLSQILANKPFGKRHSGPLIVVQQPLSSNPVEHDTLLVTLAMRTLGSFDFSKHNLLEFVRECVMSYLDSTNREIRRETAITCTKLMSRAGETAPARGHSSLVVGEVLSKLLVVGIADPFPDIRKTVLTSLDTRFDHQLAQAENLRSLFIALNDEVFEIRELAITVIGRLTTRNPAYVMPSLRKTLIQLLTELEFSGDSRSKEESAQLLCILIRSSERLIKPYVEPILKALLLKLRDNNTRVASHVLAALGELAIVGGEDMIPHIGELLPLIIDTLQDQSSATKREVALRTLGQLAKSTGYVITPFMKYPNLLDILLNIIKGERTPSIRKEVTKVIGILGALDPHQHKMNQLSARSKEEQKTTDEKSALSKGPTAEVTSSISASSEEYYPTVAITALMRILRDPTLSAHHNIVVQAVMFIFKSLGLKCVPFLPQIIPPLLQVTNTREPQFREFLFHQLGTLVSIVKQHIRDYLDEIFALIEKHWNSNLLVPIINLVEEISLALNDEFKVYLPNLIPQVLSVLHTDRSPKRAAALRVLHALEMFGNNLDDYLHLVIPAVVKLFEQVETPPPARIHAIQTIGRLSKKLNFSDYASRIVHPLARVLDSSEFIELREDVMQTLCNLVLQMGQDYNIFVPMLGKILVDKGIQHPVYDTLVARLLKNQPLVPETGEDSITASPTKHPEASTEEQAALDLGMKKLKVNEQSLKRAWEASQRSTKEDWAEWIRRFSVELLRESPSPALRSCLTLAQDYPPLVRELFNAGFVSCWNELHEQFKDELVHSLETAFLSSTIPHEILQVLLNLAEFMEHDDKPLPIDISTLGALAEKCHAYAKALHYKETEFHNSPATCIEALISINNQLQQPEAAIGILVYAQQIHSIELKESWYEKLRRWEDALAAYERKQKDDPTQPEYMLGRMRCLHAMGEWERLSQLSKEIWKTNQDATRHAAAPLAAAAAWNMGEWSSMEEYAGALSSESVEGTFFRAILEVHRDNYSMAQRYVDTSRELLDAELTGLVGESYNRAYKVVVRIQQLSELEEIIEYKKSKENVERQGMIRTTWKRRLKGCQQNVEVWQSILAVHSLVIPPHEELDMWLKFIGLCRKGGRLALAHKTLTMLMGKDPALQPSTLPNAHPRVTFAYIKQLWSAGDKTPAFEKLRIFVQAMKTSDDISLLGQAYLKQGEWQLAMRDTLDEISIPQIMSSLRSATECDTNWYKAWHAWALINFQVVAHYSHRTTPPETLLPHLVPAIHGFFRSIALAPDQSFQDTLRLLTLWFKYGALKDVEAALLEGFNTVSIDTWLQVIPQIIARIHTPVQPVRRLIHELLTSVGKEHPQALVYPLTVASKSQNTTRLAAARSIMDKMRKHSATLVDQALLVSSELVRVAIPWNEMWHDGLEEASRLYFGPEHNVDAMLQTLYPLHALLDKGPETLREVAFQQAFGRDLQEALDWCKKYVRSGKESDLNQAWDLYYHVFRRISRQLKEMTTVELQFVSPKLLAARDLELAVPGTYRSGETIVRIVSFAPTLTVFDTKQKPRKLSIHGSNGVEYEFLIKGHEDLRQDERVMQLFGLVNNLLAQNHEIAKSHLSIERYEVTPLSPSSGLIGWVPHSDILHTLIRDYRESRKILLNIEHRLMLQMSSDYDNLPLLQKVEIFEYALDSTNGHDLAKVLWLKSRNSEMWLDRRTNYTRSLAVMSMVGYILGLGDRHPRNLMIDKLTGRIIHIDFGDCFEVAMHREKYPEKIPFRLTRMLINAMEVSGIEGNFRITCEAVMGVLRNNHDSLMAVLEAFVYDPLINWRLFTPDTSAVDAKAKGKIDEEGDDDMSSRASLSQRATRSRAEEQDGDTSEVMNEQALTIINRIAKKLSGRDFGKDETLDVPAQVQRLIDQATSNENLCQCYIGWCPFW